MHQVRPNRTAELEVWRASDVVTVGRKCRSNVRDKYHEMSLGKHDYSSFVYIIITKNVPCNVEWMAETGPVKLAEESRVSNYKLAHNMTEYCKLLR